MVTNIKKIFSDKAFLLQLTGFVILQIFIDIYRPFFESRYQLFGISLPEIVNLFYFLFLTFVFFVRGIKKPKTLLPLGIYLLLFAIYLVFHLKSAASFDGSILQGSEKNLFKEVYFILRTYLIPLFITFYFLFSGLDRSFFKKTILILSTLISTNIVITNFFKISFICYASTLEKNTFITRNIFQWFFDPDMENPAYMTSKGWFYTGNQIGLILLMLFVFVIMFALESGKMRDYLIAFSNALAMIMVGTKVAALGCCIVLVLGLIFALVFGIFMKKLVFSPKHIIAYLVLTALCFSILPFSPTRILLSQQEDAFTVTAEQKKAREELKNRYDKILGDIDRAEGVEKENAEKELLAFQEEFFALLNENPFFFGIDPNFVYLFPTEGNFDFWFEIATGDNTQANYRKFKTVLFDEVLEKNGRGASDTLFGIGYISGFPYSEQDFVSQNIWFGILGTALLVGPYYLLFAWGILLALKRIKTCFIYENAFFALFIGLTTLLALMAGHLFFGVFSITVFAFISAYFFKFQRERYQA